MPETVVPETATKEESDVKAGADLGVTTAPETTVPEIVAKGGSEAAAAETGPAVTAVPEATVTDTTAPVPAVAPPVNFTEEASNAVNTAFPKVNDGITDDAALKKKTAQEETVEEGTSKLSSTVAHVAQG